MTIPLSYYDRWENTFLLSGFSWRTYKDDIIVNKPSKKSINQLITYVQKKALFIHSVINLELLCSIFFITLILLWIALLNMVRLLLAVILMVSTILPQYCGNAYCIYNKVTDGTEVHVDQVGGQDWRAKGARWAIIINIYYSALTT